jgi:hypothetical protein
VDGSTGVLVDGTDPQVWAAAIRRLRDAQAAGSAFQPADIRRHAEGFSRDRFLTAMAAEIAAIAASSPAEAARW